MPNNQKLNSIPTNIITGFLGAGKTSVILHLLKQKPKDERWAVLVNEFGEIGVDGSLIEAQIDNRESIFIQEVSGGCMCCSSGLTMQVALNNLLKEAKPHRLLIEPTGLGHPLEVLEVLSNKYYKDVLSLEKTITLVDARNIANKRYTEHLIFNQQLLIADIVVGSKLDLYGAEDKKLLVDYIEAKSTNYENIVFVEHGQLPFSLLKGKTRYSTPPKHHKHSHNTDLPKKLQSIPESGFIKAVNKGEGFHSIGWRFSAVKIFDREKLYTFISKLNVTRVKAVFITSEGIFSYNVAADNVSEVELNECKESCIEIICDNINTSWEKELFNSLNK